jgi:AraC-like DNA-binding protein
MTSKPPPSQPPREGILPPFAQWRWVSGFGKADLPPARHAGHEAWMRTNTERHDFREMMLVLEGGGLYAVQGRPYRLSPGLVILFDRGMPHDRFYSPFQPAGRHLWLRLSSSHRIMGNELTCRPRPGGKGDSAVALATRRHVILQGPFAECLIQSWDACSAGDRRPEAVSKLKAAAAALFLEALTRTDEPAQPAHSRAVIEEVRAYIAANLKSDLSLKALAHLSGYEPHYLERLLRRQTGEPVRRYVNRLRLERARELLAGGLSVGAAAEALGFGSAAYFSRFFARAAGVSPSRWIARAAAAKIRKDKSG